MKRGWLFRNFLHRMGDLPPFSGGAVLGPVLFVFPEGVPLLKRSMDFGGAFSEGRPTAPRSIVVSGFPRPLSHVHLKYHQHRTYRAGSCCVLDVFTAYYPLLNEDIQRGIGGISTNAIHIVVRRT